jgi:hypothetical protein
MSDYLTKDDIIKLVSKLSHKYTKPIEKTILFKYPDLSWGNNGIGDRWCRKIFNYTVNYADGGSKTYSENDNDGSDNVIKSREIVSILPHSIKKNKDLRPISTEIKNKIRKQPCINCYSENEIVCDHKNDFYNDKRVLNIKTQLLSDFQPLCNACNLRKRQINKIEKKTKTLFQYKTSSRSKFEYPWQLKIYDEKDINNKVHTYWFDIKEFQRKEKLYHDLICPLNRDFEIHRSKKLFEKF